MPAQWVRVCPVCGQHNPPEQLRCGCGTLLLGIDLTRPPGPEPDPDPAPAPAQTSPAEPAATPAAAPWPAAAATPTAAPAALPAGQGAWRTCGHPDCAQPNPPGTSVCVYCNRPLAAAAWPSQPAAAGLPGPGLMQLPSALRARYRLVQALHAKGMEAEILLIEPLPGAGPPAAQAPTLRVAKVFRQGILPSPEVQQRSARVDPSHRVQVFETGISDGHAYKVMEYCPLGSLRERMPRGQPLPLPFIREVASELAQALAAVHAAALVHRDIKPENVLLRREQPLDLVLTDFGTASTVDATQRFTTAARTVLYAPPEALSGVIDAKADYWALGMLLLEMAIGSHPFAGLSEAVILHSLTTRAIDTRAVSDAPLRQLLRGLLLRDPRRRWGQAELARWLAGDSSLPQAWEDSPHLGFAQPYTVMGERCTTPEQLGVALARHWQAGLADLANGQLLQWFTEVHKDQDVVRELLHLRHESGLSPSQQLLRLILHLAPGIAPVWQGRSVELPALLSVAAQALQGDQSAGQWLADMHQQRVLHTYAQAGNAQAAELVQRWGAAADAFGELWQQRSAWLHQHSQALSQPGEVVCFDQVVYGQHAGVPSPPPAASLHPRLLALMYDANWAQRLRQRLHADVAALALACPWLLELGDPRTLPEAELLVCEALLPAARQVVGQQARREAERARQLAQQAHELRERLHHSLEEIAQQARQLDTWWPEVQPLRACLQEHAELMAQVRASGGHDADWLALRQQALRSEAVTVRLRRLCERLDERMTANAGWLSENVLLTVAALVGVVLVLSGARLAWRMALLMAMLVLGLAAWRLLPVLQKVRDIHQLGRMLARSNRP